MKDEKKEMVLFVLGTVGIGLIGILTSYLMINLLFK